MVSIYTLAKKKVISQVSPRLLNYPAEIDHVKSHATERFPWEGVLGAGICRMSRLQLCERKQHV